MTSQNFVPSNQYRHLRACMVCSIVLHYQKFVQNGCPNCEPYLGMQNQTDVVTDCTSQVFEGLITLQNPKASWVAKWQRLTEYCEGVYATKVVGILPEEFIQNLEDNGIKYIPRDGTAEEDEV